MTIRQHGSDIDGTFRVAAQGATRTISVIDGVARTSRLEATLGGAVDLEGIELGVIIDTAEWRHDVPIWRWRVADADDATDALAAPDVDDASWRVVPHLHPILTARPVGDSWFRAPIEVPDRWHGRPLEIVIGGLDDQDWDRYAVFLGGLPVGSWTGSGRIRTARHLTLQPDHPAYVRLIEEGSAVLAVRCGGMSRDVAGRVPGELEHHFFQDWLVDQYVAVGTPTCLIDDFRVVARNADPDGAWLELELASDASPELSATIRHSAEGSVLRKSIELHNGGTAPLAVLDVVGEAWSGAITPTDGGRGQPVVVGDLFVGIEHPAGVGQADRGQVRIVQMPGVTIEPGASWEAQPIVIGGRDADGVASAFRTYVTAIRPRPKRRSSVYSALGWYDFTNPADPLPELSEELIEENLGQIAELGGDRPLFDVYMIDDWWDPADMGRFRRSSFPSGGAATVARIKAAGMRAGLWWATTRAVWTSLDAPGMEASWANDPAFGAPVELAGGVWRWLEEFTTMFIGERRLCLASEPYRSMYSRELPRHVAELDLAMLKMDCAILNCTSSAHDHRPGRHSMEPMVEALRALVERCETVAPGFRASWYWGFRSPWYLRFGDMLFDKGLLMEAATVASAPAPTTRQSLTVNVDEAIRHARFLPLRLQDSLGVWLGDVAWCNRIGTEEWREAYLVDAARGSDLIQLWGDLTLLETDDRAFLAAVTPWLRRQDDATARTTEIGGDPWRAEPYGYAREADGGLVVTLVNPGWSHASVELDRRVPGWPVAPWSAVELYPYPGLVEGATDRGLRCVLAPFEVRVLSIAPRDRVPVGLGVGPRPAPRTSTPITVDGAGALRRVPGQEPLHVRSTISLPGVERDDALYVFHRLEKDGEWAYDAEPQALVSFDARIDGLAASWETLPRVRDRNGPGSPWVSRRLAVGPAWSGRTVDVTIESRAPTGITVHTQAMLVSQWWRRSRRRFADLLAPPTR